MVFLLLANTKNERNIEFLINKYKTKQPGEKWDKKKRKGKWKRCLEYETKKIRIAQIMMGRLNIKGKDKERVIRIIKDIDDFKQICANCSNEKIIAVICFYIMKINNTSIKIEDYKVFIENKLNEKSCLTIITKICNYYQTKTIIL